MGNAPLHSRLASTGGRRMTQVCDRCRKRKIKCDAREPSCANCENSGVLCQTLRPIRKRGRKALKSPSALRATPEQLQPQHESNPSEYEYVDSSLEFSTSDQTSPLSTDQFPTTVVGLLPRQQQQQQQQQSPRLRAVSRSFDRTGGHGNGENALQPDPGDAYSPKRIADKSLPSSNSHPLLAGMAQDLFAMGATQSLLSYMTTYVDLFFDNIYPTYPVLYRPTIDLSIERLAAPGGVLDSKSFTLVTAVCAYTAAVLPASIPAASWPISEIFYRTSRKGLDLYAEHDIENPDHTSLVVRCFHSGWVHAAGRSKASWHILGECVRIAQSMRLHDERSYERMPHLEGQLCRRVFWTLYTGDKSAAILGGHPICLHNDLFKEGITAKYPEDFPNQDIFHVTTPHGISRQLTIMTGFNANQDLWRAAESLLVMEAGDFAHMDRVDPTISLTTAPAMNFNRLTTLFVKFRTSLDNLPSVLRFHSSIPLLPDEFMFSDQASRVEVPRAMAIQRTNLQISYQCLKIVILRKFPTLFQNRAMNCLESTVPPSSQDKTLDLSTTPSSHYGDSTTTQVKGPNTPSFILETLQIAEDMLYIIHTSSLELIRLNGEACTEKIRLVGAAILELIAHNPSSSLVGAARKYREFYPHILAMLESKASDHAEYNAGEG